MKSTLIIAFGHCGFSARLAATPESIRDAQIHGLLGNLEHVPDASKIPSFYKAEPARLKARARLCAQEFEERLRGLKTLMLSDLRALCHERKQNTEFRRSLPKIKNCLSLAQFTAI